MSSSTRSTSTIEDLPPEMINELFKNLPLKDLVACSLVNKRWHSIYSKFKLNSLVAIDFPYSRPLKWYEIGSKIEDKQMCHIDHFCGVVNQPIASNLRYVALFASFAFRMDLNELNRFSQLQHLEFDGQWLIKRKLHLNLPQLKVLAIHDYNERCPVSVDCPKLELLLYRGEPANSNFLEVKHPETIRKLEFDMLGEKLSPFKNVECLVTRRLQVIDQSTLLSLPKLQELHFHLDGEPCSKLDIDEVFGAEKQLKEFLSDLHLFRDSRSFRFRFATFELNNTANLNRINFRKPLIERIDMEYAWRYMEFYLNNIDLIDPSEPVEFIHPVHYTALMRHFDGKLPSCFFQKFKGIERVLTEWIEDADHFLWFLKSLSPLRMLRLKIPTLGQEFYDQLPAFAQSLEELELYEPGETSLKFDFVNNLPRLSYLRIIFNGPPPLESMSSFIGSARKPMWVETFFTESKGDDHYWTFEKSKDSIVWKTRGLRSKERFEEKKPEELLDFFKRCSTFSNDAREEESEQERKKVKTTQKEEKPTSLEVLAALLKKSNKL